MSAAPVTFSPRICSGAMYAGVPTTSPALVSASEASLRLRLFSTGDAGHGRPFYFHFFVILFGCFPASFFAIISFVKRREPEPRQRLFNRLMLVLFWVVLILFSIVKTKTVLYSSLTWFPVTYCAALYLDGLIADKRAPSRPLLIGLGAFACLVSLTITLFPILLMHK